VSLAHLALWGWAALALLMLALWAVQCRTRNAGPVDVAWAFGTGMVTVWFALGADGGTGARQWLVAALAAGWASRLGAHLWRRVGSESEDGRYRYLREKLGARVHPFMFVFFQVQALWALLFALPMWAAATAPGTGLAWNDWAGLAVWIASMCGESLADRQLARFRADPANRGRVCTVGLWGWSRHPNYFFEWLHWFAYVLIGIGSPHWWVTLAGVAAMYAFLTRVTGIPWTEQQALRSRGEAYRRYQETTSAFFPWPPGEPRAQAAG
jgi:steroid 5-alpha reductase family enzyme